MSDVQSNEPTDEAIADEEIPDEALDEVAGGLFGDAIHIIDGGGGGGGGSGWIVGSGGNGGNGGAG
jgi:hypothetical protein